MVPPPNSTRDRYACLKHVCRSWRFLLIIWVPE